MSIRRLLAGITVIAALGALSACGSTSETPPATALGDDAVTVGSFDFPESTLLAEIYSQAIESKGFTVERQFGIGPRELVLPAMSAGFIEFVPEYLGTALQFLSLGAATQRADASSTHAALDETLRQGHFEALASAPAQDANAFFVTSATADRFGLRTLSDLAKVDQDLTFGGPAECASRPLCLVGLHDRYGLGFKEVLALDTGGAVTRQALREGAVDVALLFTTDPAIDSEGFVELEDDKDLQPSENVTPLVRSEVVDRWGADFIDVVDAVSERLTTAELRALNAKVADAGDDVSAVARTWLEAQGLL